MLPWGFDAQTTSVGAGRGYAGAARFLPHEAIKTTPGTVEPDALFTATDRLRFFAEGLSGLHERDVTPASMEELEDQLKRRSFRVVISGSHGSSRSLAAADEGIFDAPPADRRRGRTAYELRRPAQRDVPPSIRVTGLRTTPSIEWHRDRDGRLTYQIRYD